MVFLSQEEYSHRIVTDWEEMTGRNVRLVETPAQQTTPPRTGELVSSECGTGRRKKIAEIFYSARCTRPDESLSSGRVARYVDKWYNWAEAELEHLVGYIANTADYSLFS